MRELPNRSAAGLVISVALLLLGGCFSQKIPVELPRATILPIVPAGSEAVQNAQPISLVRPRDTREDPKLYKVIEASAFPITVVQNFVPETDVGVWVGNGLADGLENAGYKVKRVDSVQAAETRVVIAVGVTELSHPPRYGILIVNPGCNVRAAITVRITKAARTILDNKYDAEGWCASGGCLQPGDLSSASKKALEALLAKAVPEIALTLRAMTQPGEVAGSAATDAPR